MQSKMKILYMIMCHKNLRQVSGLIKQLITSDSDVVVHVDKAVSDDEYRQFQKWQQTIPNLYLTEKRIKGILDDRTLVDVVFIMMDCVRKKGLDYQYYALLSGQDYPIKPIGMIHSTLNDTYPQPYIGCTAYSESNWIYYKFRIKRSPWVKRTDRSLTDRMGAGNPIGKMLRFVLKVCRKTVAVFGASPYKKLTRMGVSLYGGSAWWILPDTAMDCIYDEYKKNTEVVRQLLVSYTPEETFFQTMAMRSPVKDAVTVDDAETGCKTWAYFSDEGKPFVGHPYVFTVKEFEKLKASECWFARKFDDTVDAEILRMIDKELLVPDCSE